MKRFLKSEPAIIIQYVLASLLLGAVLMPWLWRGGMWLAELVKTGDYWVGIEWLGHKAGHSAQKYGRYYSRSLMFSALVLLPWLRRNVGRVRSRDLGLRAPRLGDAAADVAWGFLIASAIFTAMAACLKLKGIYVPVESAKAHVWATALASGIGASLGEEFIFRGVLLGIWLRCARPATACVGSSLLFAFLHFLAPHDMGENFSPGHPMAGLALLGNVLAQYLDPRFFTADFATLFCVGLVLAWARVRSGSLWFPIGLHAGWVTIFRAFGMLYEHNPENHMSPVLIGESIRTGLIPLMAICITALVCMVLFRQRVSRA